MHFPLLQVAIAALVALPAATWGQQITMPTGATITGTLTTNAAGHQVQVFRGIPYAEPPVGDKRWKPATAAAPITKDLNATSFRDACLSNPRSDGPLVVTARSEDCLFLNVYTPAGATPDSNFPVMVWTHGGRFVGGSSNGFDGSNLIGAADNEMVYVSINYRLGIMGFLSNEQQMREGVGGNFGLRDQEVAYDWIKQHIRHFGGNPDDVTAFGESAGAMSIAMHLVANDGKQQYFQKAIMQSGSYTPYFAAMLSPANAADYTATLAQGVGCAMDDKLMSCLRAVNGSDIMEAAGLLAWLPSVDGVFFRESPLSLLESGRISRVPSIIGTNTDEGWLFTFGVDKDADFAPFMNSFFSRVLPESVSTQMEALYPSSEFATTHLRAAEVAGDVVFDCPSEKLSHVLAATGTPTYRYRFAQRNERFGALLAAHTTEIPYVFNGAETVRPADADAALVGTMQEYWVNFAKTGSPNGYRNLGAKWSSPYSLPSSHLDQVDTLQKTDAASSPLWPRFEPISQQRIVLQTNITVEKTGVMAPTHNERCAFWDVVNADILATTK